MPATETDVANMALTELGDTLIADINVAGTLNARALLLLPTARDMVLTMAEWNFAKVMARLTAMPIPPVMKWAYQFTLPASPPCLDILSTSLGHGGLYERGYHTEYGPILYADETPISIEYIASLALGLWTDPMAIEVLVKVLASQLAKALTGQSALAKEKLGEAAALIPLGIARNKKEGHAVGQYAAQPGTLDALSVMNQALGEVGVPTVRDFDDDTREAHEVRVHYATALDSTLEMHPWNFAKFLCTLTASDRLPLFGAAHQYALPNGHRYGALPYCLTVRSTDGGNGAHFQIGNDVVDGRVLYSNEAAVMIEYTGRVTDLSQWSALAIQVLVKVLASKIAPALQQQIRGLSQALLKEAFALLPVAQRKDGREGYPMVLRPNRVLVSSRQRTGIGSAYVGIRTYLP